MMMANIMITNMKIHEYEDDEHENKETYSENSLYHILNNNSLEQLEKIKENLN